jgi:hypothetical protein
MQTFAILIGEECASVDNALGGLGKYQTTPLTPLAACVGSELATVREQSDRAE